MRTFSYSASNMRYGYGLLSRRSRNAVAILSSPWYISLTCHFERPATLSAVNSFSTRRVATPPLTACWMTLTRTRSLREGFLTKAGPWPPLRSLGTRRSIVSRRVSRRLGREPLRYPLRSSERSQRSTPTRALTSAL